MWVQVHFAQIYVHYARFFTPSCSMNDFGGHVFCLCTAQGHHLLYLATPAHCCPSPHHHKPGSPPPSLRITAIAGITVSPQCHILPTHIEQPIPTTTLHITEQPLGSLPMCHPRILAEAAACRHTHCDVEAGTNCQVHQAPHQRPLRHRDHRCSLLLTLWASLYP